VNAAFSGVLSLVLIWIPPEADPKSKSSELLGYISQTLDWERGIDIGKEIQKMMSESLGTLS
jgi:hypothetical protein